MLNAAEGTKKAANVITDTDCDHDGLVPFLKFHGSGSAAE